MSFGAGTSAIVWSRAFLDSLVDVSPVPNVVQIDSTLPQIEFVNHPIITDTKFELRTPLQPLVPKTFQPRAHFVHPALNGFTNRTGK